MATFEFVNQKLVLSNRNREILVADSFLVKNGRVRSLDKHVERFKKQVAQKAPELEALLPEFIGQAHTLIPKFGSYFPRLELQGDGSLKLQLREAPSIGTEATLWTYSQVDPRTDLTVKGPELELGFRIRNLASLLGADEAVLLNENGFITEGALSSLVWWEEGILTAPGPDLNWLESVTRTEVFEVAQKLGIATQTKRAKPEDLVGIEVWLLSSLQGIRVVTNWLGVSNDFKQSDLKARFEAELALMEQDLL